MKNTFLDVSRGSAVSIDILVRNLFIITNFSMCSHWHNRFIHAICGLDGSLDFIVYFVYLGGSNWQERLTCC